MSRIEPPQPATPLAVVVTGRASAPWLAALQREVGGLVVTEAPPQGPWLELAADSFLPPHWLPRLRRHLGESSYDALLAWDLGVEALNPLADDALFEGDAASLDALLYQLGARAPQPCPPAATAAILHLGGAAPPLCRFGLITDLLIPRAAAPLRGPRTPRDPRDRPPRPLGAEWRAAYARISGQAPMPCWPGADGRAVVLHILHGWGGGVERFVRDYADGDPERWHLALCASGHRGRQRYGEKLGLFLVRDDRLAPLLEFELRAPISSTAIEHGEWRAVLGEIRARFPISALLISSLIGHSLDALRSGLPCEYICHDYYPLWPILHADFGDATQSFSAADLADALASTELPFQERDASFWIDLRAAFVATVVAQSPILVAPSESVRRNWARIEPRLPAIQPPIAHGLRALAAPIPDHTDHTDRLRVAVVGRVNGGKGEALIHAALKQGLGHQAELFLLGAGPAGHGFFGLCGVHVVLDYRRDDLPRLLAALRIDLVLLPATVAESFSYVLSEMWALRQPVLATRLGAYAERIEHGLTGFLCAPEASDLVAQVEALARNRALLNAVRERLASHTPADIATMAAAHRALLPEIAAPALLVGQFDMGAALADRAERAEAALHLLQSQAREQVAELERRADWASALTRERDTQAQLSRRRQDELDRAHGEILRLQAEFDERSQWALQLDSELVEVRARWERDHASWQLSAAAFEHEIDRRERERLDFLASTSWRLTRPVRAIKSAWLKSLLRLRYWIDRIHGGVPRLLRSLRVRGLRGTLQRLQQGPGLAIDRSAAPPQPQLLEMASTSASIAITHCAEPRVSIVIPVFNKWHYTETCLRSLVAEGANVSFEVIVVDDGSSDETGERLAALPGVVAIRNAQNLGFVGSCNAGAAAARGEFVVFLNNDTQVARGWLDALIDTFASHQRVGLVGAKLVYPDGRLQEAGGIVFSDASGWNYGRFQDPRDPAYNYVRDVDYCSGAAIAIRRDLFQQLGGFDSRYAPAYYEDTDLAFAVRQAGLRVLYQPASTVYHFEGITSGTDVASGTKRFQVINQAKFQQKWSAELARQPKPGVDIRFAREHGRQKRILVIDATTPHPDEDSGSVRLVNLFRVVLGLGHKVMFFAENRAFDGRYTEALQQLGVEVLFHPFMPDPVRWLGEHGASLDLVLVSRHYVATPLVDAIRQYAPQAKLVFDTVDLHYLREEREAALSGRKDLRQIAATTKLAELKLVRRCDVTLVVSPIEQELLRREVPGANVDVLSNVHEVIGRRKGFSERRDLYFVGGFQHQPNVDAMVWFVAEIWPLVAAALPAAKFHIAGSRMPDSVRALASDRVIVHGFLPSLDELLDGCRLSVAPLRYGAGVKGKVNQAMAHGQPVVATTVAAEGMYLQHGVDVLVADEATAFAHEVVRLYQDEALWMALSEGGIRNLERHFSFAAAEAAVRRVLGER